MNWNRILENEEDTRKFAEEAAELLKGKVVLLNGTLGAGKTFFVKCIAEHFHCTQASSPTFTLHQQYDGDITIRHFDLYRLNSFDELENIDFWSIVESGDTCFIEWAEKFNLHDELENYIEINITVLDTNRRQITAVTDCL
ncbi:tRNA (adenosine(37)-N6)-threonylcarbamoyltransferase complex ATPase subunit type 1 TsaE [Seleniivibrio sp.]|uniref:tRNA (adenosine(37)-N6)-threonylcarbamoyltransferase complex ATPase subunit type 1 TsaE n=1 Tax=Seleniivibrio sp. TaxID=2898801 RepID=UPI0025F4E545|nr:tRNA (adenosine(37)-N6)-threonylcarbamoyltransferase complex ATPase subunit type 1 TsaE [Seleniivibrio sp.]MCD8554670.1 tRNA (adenosine(37)-N6)-threonylcarbamoyltransferase complex ATPase subunit type 1 TsaE [Seleniivibrio sp.]